MPGVGIIPARAGFTTIMLSRRRAPSDHPRSRGVYVAEETCWVGTPRIIPARAGFTIPGGVILRET